MMQERTQRSRQSTGDVITRELIKGALSAARSEMEALVARTAMSPFIREKKDYFTAFLDAKGHLVVSTSLTLAGNLVDCILEAYPADTMRDGDLYWYNDVYASGGGVSQTNDTVMVMPVMADGRLIAFVEAWGHLWDVGGLNPGSVSPATRSIFHEGIMIPPVRVMRDGILNEEVVRIYARNSRFPETMKGDLAALMAACRLGKRRLEEAVQRYGADAVEDAFTAMLDQSAAALQARIDAEIPTGRWTFRDWIDSDAASDTSYFVEACLQSDSGKLTIDLSGSSKQAAGPINFVMDASVVAHILGLYMTRDDPAISMNAGFATPIAAVHTRPGTIVDPRFPAPVGLRSHTMIRVTTALQGALAEATGGKAAAASCVYVLYYLRSEDAETGAPKLCIEGLSVGFGARPSADGIDAVYYVAQENYPVEFAEMEFGVEIEAFSIHRDSGGPGRWRGGAGIVRDVRILADAAILGLRMDNCKYPAFGVHGGHAGKPGRIVVNPGTPNERDLPTMGDGFEVKRGDLLRVITPGGGGWGSPLDRPAEDVLGDVLDGFVSPESAHDDYGVVLTGDGLNVDTAATQARRQSLPRDTRMFHRGRYYSAHEKL
ncbi:MAG: hydantoinase B/oxoprolinase family protein [Hyphomicrobiaceae bacterium]